MTIVDLCPMCGLLREMNLSGFRTIALDAEGKKTAVLTRVYHCRTCFCFVRSEDVEDVPENLVDVVLDEDVGDGQRTTEELVQ